MLEDQTDTRNMSMPVVPPARCSTPDGKANGYRFQDAIGAELLLASFSNPSMRITFETKKGDNDKFDDLVMESDRETVRIQCKNGPDFTPTDADWRSGGRRNIKWADLCDSVESHLANGADKQRFILLTSFKPPGDLETEWLESASLWTMAGREYTCYVRKSPLDDEADQTIRRLEVVFGAEHHNAEEDSAQEETDLPDIKQSPWWEKALKCVPSATSTIDNPHCHQPDKMLVAALDASCQFRAARRRQATCDDAAEAMRIAPGSYRLQQNPPDEQFVVIKPQWINEVNLNASINHELL